jgi:hypothetical protein
VCECGSDEVPVPWLAAERASARACKAHGSPDCDEEECESRRVLDLRPGGGGKGA